MKHLVSLTLLFILIISDSCKTEEPQPRPLPTASFTWANSGEGSVQFTDNSKEAETYSWDFGDGTSSTQKSPSHDYVANKTYTVSLTVKNSSGGNAASQQINVSSIPAPKISFSYNQSINGAVSFVNSSTGAASYTWDFGDGTSSSSASPSKIYNDNKTYVVRLSGSGKGGTSTSEQSVQITSVLPLIDFTFSISNDIVAFTNKSLRASSYRWDFGDGTSSTEQSPNHKYAKAGSYNVKLTGKGTGGESNKSINVTLNAFKLTLSDVVDDPKLVNFLSGTWGNYDSGEGYRYTSDRFIFSTSSDVVRNYGTYNTYVYLTDLQLFDFKYNFKIINNIMSFQSTSGIIQRKRFEVVSSDEMKIYDIFETNNSYRESLPRIYTKLSDVERSSSDVIFNQSQFSILKGIWDQGDYSIYNNVFFDFSSGKNFYQYNTEFREAKETVKYEYKIDVNNIMSYRWWNSDFDPGWKKFKIEIVSSTGIKLYNISADGKTSSSPTYILKKRS